MAVAAHQTVGFAELRLVPPVGGSKPTEPAGGRKSAHFAHPHG